MKTKRLESLDILRGADMFLLTTLGPLLLYLTDYSHQGIMNQFHHVRWEGFALWDLIMPLFMFLSGVTIPFSMAKYGHGTPKSQALLRIARRFICLWVLGMVAQGNLLKFDWAVLKFYSNTLQTIAVGYAFSALMFLYCPKPKVHIATCIGLLLAFWAAMTFIKVGEYGGGDYSKTRNLCEYIDIQVLGTHRDGYPGPHYHYTWILSSLTFIVTVMMGMLGGELLKSSRSHKSLILVLSGAGCAAAGWLWGLEMPVIKHIWTSSMTLVAGGYSLMLLGAFYWFIDVKGWGKKALGWLKLYGGNAIVAYMVMELGYVFGLGELLNVALVVAVLVICRVFNLHVRV